MDQRWLLEKKTHHAIPIRADAVVSGAKPPAPLGTSTIVTIVLGVVIVLAGSGVGIAALVTNGFAGSQTSPYPSPPPVGSNVSPPSPSYSGIPFKPENRASMEGVTLTVSSEFDDYTAIRKSTGKEFTYTFDAANAIDGDLTTEFSSNGDGKDMTFTLTFPDFVAVTDVIMVQRMMAGGEATMKTGLVSFDGGVGTSYPVTFINDVDDSLTDTYQAAVWEGVSWGVQKPTEVSIEYHGVAEPRVAKRVHFHAKSMELPMGVYPNSGFNEFVVIVKDFDRDDIECPASTAPMMLYGTKVWMEHYDICTTMKALYETMVLQSSEFTCNSHGQKLAASISRMLGFEKGLMRDGRSCSEVSEDDMASWATETMEAMVEARNAGSFTNDQTSFIMKQLAYVWGSHVRTINKDYCSNKYTIPFLANFVSNDVTTRYTPEHILNVLEPYWNNLDVACKNTVRPDSSEIQTFPFTNLPGLTLDSPSVYSSDLAAKNYSEMPGSNMCSSYRIWQAAFRGDAKLISIGYPHTGFSEESTFYDQLVRFATVTAPTLSKADQAIAHAVVHVNMAMGFTVFGEHVCYKGLTGETGSRSFASILAGKGNTEGKQSFPPPTGTINPLLVEGGLYHGVTESGKLLDDYNISQGFDDITNEYYFTNVLGHHAAGLFSACPNTGVAVEEANFLNDNHKEGYGFLTVMPVEMRTDGVDAPKGFEIASAVALYESVTDLITRVGEPYGCSSRGSALILAIQELVSYHKEVSTTSDCSLPYTTVASTLQAAYNGIYDSLEVIYGANIIDADWGFGLITLDSHSQFDTVLKHSAAVQCHYMTALKTLCPASIYTGAVFDRKYETNVQLTNSSNTNPPADVLLLNTDGVCNIANIY